MSAGRDQQGDHEELRAVIARARDVALGVLRPRRREAARVTPWAWRARLCFDSDAAFVEALRASAVGALPELKVLERIVRDAARGRRSVAGVVFLPHDRVVEAWSAAFVALLNLPETRVPFEVAVPDGPTRLTVLLSPQGVRVRRGLAGPRPRALAEEARVYLGPVWARPAGDAVALGWPRVRVADWRVTVDAREGRVPLDQVTAWSGRYLSERAPLEAAAAVPVSDLREVVRHFAGEADAPPESFEVLAELSDAADLLAVARAPLLGRAAPLAGLHGRVRGVRPPAELPTLEARVVFARLAQFLPREEAVAWALLLLASGAVGEVRAFARLSDAQVRALLE